MLITNTKKEMDDNHRLVLSSICNEPQLFIRLLSAFFHPSINDITGFLVKLWVQFRVLLLVVITGFDVLVLPRFRHESAECDERRIAEQALAFHHAYEVVGQLEVEWAFERPMLEGFRQVMLAAKVFAELRKALLVIGFDFTKQFVTNFEKPSLHVVLRLCRSCRAGFIAFSLQHLIRHKRGEKVIDAFVAAEAFPVVENGRRKGVGDQATVVADLVHEIAFHLYQGHDGDGVGVELVQGKLHLIEKLSAARGGVV